MAPVDEMIGKCRAIVSGQGIDEILLQVDILCAAKTISMVVVLPLREREAKAVSAGDSDSSGDLKHAVTQPAVTSELIEGDEVSHLIIYYVASSVWLRKMYSVVRHGRMRLNRSSPELHT